MAQQPADDGSASSGAVEKGECPACKAANVPLKEVQGMKVCEKCASKRFSSKVRKSIQEAFDRQMLQAQRENWKKRMMLARKGMEHYDNAKWAEALKVFRDYIGILETHYSLPPGGLHPSIFVTEKEKGEILLIAGIYWDMAKIYDRMKGRQTDMRLALNKFLIFSIDRPHLIVASEAMRRYIGSGKCVHVEDFQNTHRLLRSKLAKCFIASAIYGPDSPEVEILRHFRDAKLSKNPVGRAFIDAYYKFSPPVAEAMAKAPLAASFARVILNRIVKRLNQ